MLKNHVLSLDRKLSEDELYEIFCDYVDMWHDGAGENESLADYLGLSDREYADYLEMKLTLMEILYTNDDT